MKATRKIGKYRYTKKSCHKAKGDAVRIRNNYHSRGKRAAVFSGDGSHCVYVGGNRKNK